MGKIAKIVVTTKNLKYEPSVNLYVGSEAYPSANAQKAEMTSSVDGGMTTYVQTYDLSAGDYSYFRLWNDTVGATYFDSIEITYTK